MQTNQSATVRRQQAALTAQFIVTGFSCMPRHSTTLYCDSEDDARYLVELLFRCGFDAAGFEPNLPHKS